MTTFAVADGNTTIKSEFTDTTDKVQSLANDAAHELWDRGLGDHGTVESPIEFTDLNNEDKLALLDDYMKRVLLSLANAYSIKTAQLAAVDSLIKHDI